MFTGIIQDKAVITDIVKKTGLTRLALNVPAHLTNHLIPGASVAIDGCCLTVVNVKQGQIEFDLIQETLQLSSLGLLNIHDEVNVERSAKWGDEIGGHLVSGHVHGTAQLINIEQPDNNYILTLEVPPGWIKYIIPKGFIALAGASLTVVDVDKKAHRFTVHLIPETRARTTFIHKKTGDRLNFEVDQQTRTLVDTVERYLNGSL